MSIDTEDEKKENDNGGNSTSYVSKVLNNAHYNFVKDNKNFEIGRASCRERV